ncbi:MAG: hypothetical protein ABI678_02825 [Kofleriaceae bacterium]
MRCLVLMIVAACSGSPDASFEPLPPLPIVRAPHGSAIDIVAVTADGRAAASQDVDGNTRLWPELDGSAEPIVVRMAAAAELAIVRRGDELLIASLDGNGDLQLVRITASGIQQSRSTLDRDVAIERLATTSKYLLALRADQAIAVIGVDGRERGRMGTPAGARTIAVTTRNDRAVAIVQRDGKTHTRALDLEALTWGDELAEFSFVRPQFALTPNGEELAVETQPGVVELVNLAAHTTRRGCGRESVAMQLPLGFIDDRTLACGSGTQVRWYIEDANLPVFVHAVLQPEHVAVGGDLQITAEGLALGIAKRNSVQYLGYRLTDPSMLRTGPLGLTISRDSVPLLLDRDLRLQRAIPLETLPVEDALPIDATHVLRTDHAVGGHQITLVDTSAMTRAKIATVEDYQLRFEPATNLLGVTRPTGTAVIPYDPRAHRFGDPIELAGAPGHVYLADPARADGIAAVVVEALGGVADRVRIREYAQKDLHGDGPVAARRIYELGGEVLTVDRAGRVYLETGTELHGYVGGPMGAPVQVFAIALAGRPVVAPSPDASQILVAGDDRIILVRADGRPRWSVARRGVVDLGWVEGEPVARFGAGLAKLDPRTGELRERVCGWQFALAAQAPDSAGNSASVCDAE